MAVQNLTLSANAIPGRGGQGLNLHHMIEGLRPLYRVSVFCQGGTAEVPLHPVPANRLSQFIGKTPVLRRLRDWQTYLSEVHFDRFVSRALEGGGIFQGVTGQCLESLEAARRKQSLTVLDVVTTHIDDYLAHAERECRIFGIRPPHNSALQKRIRREYETADVIRVMSDHARQTFLERGFAPQRVHVIPPPFDASAFPEAAPAGERFRVVFVGLLEPAKGFHYLVEAFRAVDDGGMELDLWGAPGARPVNAYMQKHLSECPAIRLRPGSVAQTGYQEVYGKSHVLVLPSLADGFAYVVGEAMACGIPVIVTRTTGASQWVQDGVNGYVVPPSDSGAIAERLRHLRRHPDLARTMGAAARATMRHLTMDEFRRRHTAMVATAQKGVPANV